MALINRPAADLNFKFKDESGDTGFLGLSVPYDTLASAAILGADAMMLLLPSLTGCSVEGYSLTYSKFETAPTAPAADSRVEHKGMFSFMTDAGKTVTYSIPGILPSLVDAAGNIDEDQVAVAVFVTEITALDAVWCDSNGVDIQSLLASYELFRKTSRRQAPKKRRPD